MRDRPIRVFIVEDEWLYREAVVGALSSSSDFEVCGQKEEAEAALASMLADPPDIALVDLELPGTSGLELSRRIQGVLPDTKIVILTVSRRPEDLRAALAAGASGFVVKQDTRAPEKLHEVLRIVAEGGTLLTSTAARDVLIDLATRQAKDPAAKYGLTTRERDVLALLSSGASNHEIAKELLDHRSGGEEPPQRCLSQARGVESNQRGAADTARGPARDAIPRRSSSRDEMSLPLSSAPLTQ